MSLKKANIMFFLFILVTTQNRICAQQTGKWQQYLNSHLINIAKRNGAPPGIYTVIVSFLLDSTGKIYDIAIEKNPGYNTADEVRRVFENAPAWPLEIVEKEKGIRIKQSINFDVK